METAGAPVFHFVLPELHVAHRTVRAGRERGTGMRQGLMPASLAAFRGTPRLVRPDPLAGDAGSFAVAEARRHAGQVVVAIERFGPLEAPMRVQNPLLRVARHLATPLRFCHRPDESSPWTEEVIGPGQHFVFSAGGAACFHWEEGFRTFSLTLGPEAAVPARGAGVPVLVQASDPMLERLTGALLQDCLEGFPRGDTFIEGLGLAIAAHVGGQADERGEAAAPLPGPQLRAVRDAVEDLVGESFALTDLAARIGVPARRLGAGFRAATGQALWDYVLERRIARAECLLRETDRPLAAIAIACGFSSQAHFTTAFRRLRGVTPGAWRRALRGGGGGAA